MYRAGGRFGTEEIGRPDLHPRGTESHRGGDTIRVGDTACGNNRHLHGTHDLRQQCHRSRLRDEIIGQENTAVPSGFKTLRDDGVNPMRFEPARLFYSGGRGNYFCAPRPHARQQIR